MLAVHMVYVRKAGIPLPTSAIRQMGTGYTGIEGGLDGLHPRSGRPRRIPRETR